MHRVFEVPVPAAGRLFVMPCPSWANLGMVLDGLTEKGVTTVLSLLPGAEAEELGVGQESAQCAARGLTFLRFPIEDFGLPEPKSWAALITALMIRAEAGEGLAVHCRAGIGRSGMVAACLLVALGETPAQALLRVSTARGVSVPDTVDQGDFVATFAQMLKSGKLAGA